MASVMIRNTVVEFASSAYLYFIFVFHILCFMILYARLPLSIGDISRVMGAFNHPIAKQEAGDDEAGRPPSQKASVRRRLETV